MRTELEKVRHQLTVCMCTARSYANLADEGEEAAAELQRQLSEGFMDTAVATGPEVTHIEIDGIFAESNLAAAIVRSPTPDERVGRPHQVRQDAVQERGEELRQRASVFGQQAPDGSQEVHALREDAKRLQAQVIGLRKGRDEGLAAHDSWSGHCDDEGIHSPRDIQVQRRCKFLGAQLQALLRHCPEIDELQDSQHDDTNSAAAQDPTRLDTSLMRLQNESAAAFNELSEGLHTLEVQKADAELELQRMHSRLEEQEVELLAVQRERAQLLAELGSALQVKGDNLARTESTKWQGVESDTSSAESCTSLNAANLFFGNPVSGQLRSSPKVTGALRAGVQKVVKVNQLQAHMRP